MPGADVRGGTPGEYAAHEGSVHDAATGETRTSPSGRVPGIFACGGVRPGPVKRVAGAVGEGSMVIAVVHQHLAQQEALATA